MLENLDKEITISRGSNKQQPLYEQIRRQLYKIIKDGDFPPGSRLPGTSALTKRLKVNYRTLKTALNLLQQDGVIRCMPNKRPVVVKNCSSPDSEQKINISFVRMVADAFSAAISEGINKFAEEHNAECIIADAHNDYERFIDSINHPGNDVNGLLVIPYELPECRQAVKRAINSGLEVVFIDRKLDGVDACSVCSDHFLAGYQATRHLLTRHGQPVYHIGTITQPSSCRQWVQGWKTAMNEFNYTNPDEYLFKIETSEAELAASIRDYNRSHIENAEKFFDKNKSYKYSIFAGNDYVARGIYTAADNLGLKIGEDVFITSISNLPFAEKLPVPLTSVDQNLRKVGYESAKILYERLTGSLPKSIHRVLPVNLVVRESSTAKK